MKSVNRLVAEHDIIERGLTVLEKVVARIEKGQTGYPQRWFRRQSEEVLTAHKDSVQ